MKAMVVHWIEEQLQPHWEHGWCEINDEDLRQLLDAAEEFEHQLRAKHYDDGWKDCEKALIEMLKARHESIQK
jgi:hypothetical protein